MKFISERNKRFYAYVVITTSVVIKPVFHKARSSPLQTWHAPAYL